MTLAPGQLTFRFVIEEFWKHKGHRYSKAARRNHQDLYAKIVPALGDLSVSVCAPILLMQWVDGNLGWTSDWTRRWAVAAVNVAFNWAVKMELITRNPFLAVSYPEGDPRRVTTDAELRTVCRLSTAAFRRVLYFMRWTGCRRGELVKVRLKMIDWAQGCITIDDHKTKKKSRKPRVIPLCQKAYLLMAWLVLNQKGLGPDDFVFRTTTGKPWTGANIANHWDRLRVHVSPGATIHGLRHAFGTAAALAGVNVKVLAHAMGHSSISTTLKYYVHMDGELEAMQLAAAAASTTPRSRPPTLPGRVSISRP